MRFRKLIFLISMAISLASPAALATPDTLDYGLYWFDGNNQSVKGVEHDGTVNSVSTTYYDPAKPTVIYFHGWQPGSVPNNYAREDFHFVYESTNVITSTSWKSQGWNVAIYYWNQFADEAEVKDAEAKIWSANGPQQMRYRLADGSYSTSLSPNKSVSQLAFEHISAVLANDAAYNLRLVGHSLGNQLATQVAKKISDAVQAGSLSLNVMPVRLELLDPFWSKNGKSYLGDANGDGNDDWVGERVRWDAQEMINQYGLAVTWYKTSPILDVMVGDKNVAFEAIATFIHNRYWYLDSADWVNKHNHAVPWYFWSKASAAPEEVTINWWGRRNPTGLDAASATTADSRIQQMMGDTYHWDQVEGRYTVDPSDDQFERKNY